MSKAYEIEGAEIKVVSGEFTENKIKGQKYYHAVCECNGNTILITKNITGLKSGKVTLKKVCIEFAPSIFAASESDEFIPAYPPIKITVL